jgi:serine palmitoyltransferase
LQKIVDEAAEAGVLVTRARRLRGQEAFEPEPSLKVCLSSALSKKEVEKSAQALKAAIVKVCGSEWLCDSVLLRAQLT